MKCCLGTGSGYDDGAVLCCVVDEVEALKRELYTFMRLVRDVLE